MRTTLLLAVLAFCWCAFVQPAQAQCGSDVICASQCIPRNTLPALLHGRPRVNSGGSPSDGGEGEEVQWEISYNNYSWSAIPGATAADYQPVVATQTTFYRRVSSHILYRTFLGWDYDFYYAQWYISNVATITTTPLPAPIPSTTQVTTCGNPASVSVYSQPGAVTYNWWVPYAGWDVSDGVQPYFSTFNQNGSFVTSATTVSVRFPAGTPAGDYTIAVSANAPCGSQSADGTIVIHVDYTPTGSPTWANFVGTPVENCGTLYDLVCEPVPNAISYQATLSSGERAYGTLNAAGDGVDFPFSKLGPANNVTATIIARGPCGTGPGFTSAPVMLARPMPGCNPKEGAMPQGESVPAGEVISGIYPNPATNQVTLQGLGQDAQVSFYNANGKLLKTISLHKADTQTAVNLLDLPNGTYYLRTSAKGKPTTEQHLVIRH